MEMMVVASINMGKDEVMEYRVRKPMEGEPIQFLTRLMQLMAEFEVRQEFQVQAEPVKADEEESQVQVETAKAEEEPQVEAEPVKEEEEPQVQAEEESQVQAEPQAQEELTKVEEEPQAQVESAKGVKEPQRIPEIWELEHKAKNFEEFVDLVANFLDMGAKIQFFRDVIQAATNSEKINWKEINKQLMSAFQKNAKIADQQLFSKKIHSYFNGKVRPLELIGAVASYYDYDFHSEEPIEPEKNADTQSTQQAVQEMPSNCEELLIEQEKSQNYEEQQAAQVTPQNCEEQQEIQEAENSVKMNCLPSIPEFEKRLARIDKTKPIESRVRYVLGSMGENKVKDVFVKIAVAAVESEEEKLEIEQIMRKAKVRREEAKETRYSFAKLISDFAKKNGSRGKVKVIDFLEDLRRVVK